MRPSIAAFATLVLVLLGVPRGSEAGILDFIWEMSGPQMLGYSYGCLYSLKTGKPVECRHGKVPIAVYTTAVDPDKQQRSTQNQGKGLMLGFNASIMGSTAHDSATQTYRWFEIGMVELGGGGAFESWSSKCSCPPAGTSDPEVRVRHGVGVFYERFFGQRTVDNNGAIDGFGKFGVSVTAVDVAIKRVAFGVKLRLYPEGFSDDQFKAGLPAVSDRPFETTLGFTFSLVIPKKVKP